MAGPLAREVTARAKNLTVSPGFVPTHLVVVDANAYFAGLISRPLPGGAKDAVPLLPERAHVDLDGTTRQALISLTLCGHISWDLGGHHTFDHSDRDFPYSSAGYVHRPTEGVSDLLRYAPSGWYREVESIHLSRMCLSLDCYYRSDRWWIDRLSVALGHLWSALTTSHHELSYSALCMALEAIASTSHSEITHSLAERCAFLAAKHDAERIQIYDQVRALYATRSKIVHGRSFPKKGPITWNSLAVTAKATFVPADELRETLGLTIRVLKAVLRNKTLMALLHVRRSEEKASEALEQYFRTLVLGREASQVSRAK